MITMDMPYVDVSGEAERTRGDGAVYLRIQAETISGDNYEVEGDKTPDSRYNELKAALDKKFERMFALKAELDAANSRTQAKWNEYYALQQAYEKALKRIIAVWVMDCSDAMPLRPQPRHVEK